MKDILGKSKVRQDILRLLFLNPDKKFYLSEIAGKAGVSAGTTQRELNKLHADGMVKSEKIGNMRYYYPDKQSPVHSEVSQLVLKTIGIEAELIKALDGLDLDFAFIFGSYAKDTLKSDSDIDLFLIGRPEENILLNRINDLEVKIGREINFHSYPPVEFKEKIKTSSFLSNIVKHYKLLIGDNHDFRRLFK